MYQNIRNARIEDQNYYGKYIYNKVPPHTESHRPLESRNKCYNKSTSVRLLKTNISSHYLRLFYIEGRLPSKVVFRQRSSSVKGRYGHLELTFSVSYSGYFMFDI